MCNKTASFESGVINVPLKEKKHKSKENLWQFYFVWLPTGCHNFTFKLHQKFHQILPKFFSDTKIGDPMHVCQKIGYVIKQILLDNM